MSEQKQQNERDANHSILAYWRDDSEFTKTQASSSFIFCCCDRQPTSLVFRIGRIASVLPIHDAPVEMLALLFVVQFARDLRLQFRQRERERESNLLKQNFLIFSLSSELDRPKSGGQRRSALKATFCVIQSKTGTTYLKDFYFIFTCCCQKWCCYETKKLQKPTN